MGYERIGKICTDEGYLFVCLFRDLLQSLLTVTLFLSIFFVVVSSPPQKKKKKKKNTSPLKF